MSEIVKCFHGNLDGIREGLVVARSQKQAAEIVGCSLHAFRDYWSSGKWPTDWNPKPYTLYTRLYKDQGTPFTEGRCPITK